MNEKGTTKCIKSFAGTKRKGDGTPYKFGLCYCEAVNENLRCGLNFIYI